MSVSINGTTGITTPGMTNTGAESVTNTSTVGALVVGGDNISFAGGSTFRNRVINGAMMIDQRNAGASVAIGTTGTVYTLDRWGGYATQASKITIQQNAGSVSPPAGFAKYLGATSSSAYSVTTNDIFAILQPIEGVNIADLGWGAAGAQTVTLSFWVRSSLTGSFGGSLRNGIGTRSYPFLYTIGAANTWEYKTVTVPGDTTGAWATDNTAGVNITFGLGVGSAFSSSAGAWAAGNFPGTTGATSVVGTNGATLYITGVQLERGSVATPFENRQYGTELALCQRYYETLSVLLNTNGAGLITAWPKVQKRAAPTLTLTGTSGTGGTYVTIASTSGDTGYWQSNNNSQISGGTLTASAEL